MLTELHTRPILEPCRKHSIWLVEPAGMREAFGDGNEGGAYEKPDAPMLEIWRVAVEETRDIIGTICDRGRGHGTYDCGDG
jgi:hypothetical protein